MVLHAHGIYAAHDLKILKNQQVRPTRLLIMQVQAHGCFVGSDLFEGIEIDSCMFADKIYMLSKDLVACAESVQRCWTMLDGCPPA